MGVAHPLLHRSLWELHAIGFAAGEVSQRGLPLGDFSHRYSWTQYIETLAVALWRLTVTQPEAESYGCSHGQLLLASHNKMIRKLSVVLLKHT